MRSRFPRPLAGTALGRHVLHFETLTRRAVDSLAAGLAEGARVLDAGAGEGQYADCFTRQKYIGVDLAIGDAEWDYSRLDAIADLTALPFREDSFDACLNIVTLEHVRDPQTVLREIHRVLKPGGKLLAVVPHEWEVHQAPHDYFRYTRYGMELLLQQAGFEELRIEPGGGYFRLLARRLLNGLQFFPAPLAALLALVVGPLAVALPALDFLDREGKFTLGYICWAKKHS